MVARDHTGTVTYNGAAIWAYKSPSFSPMRRVSRYRAREFSWAPANVSRSWSPQAIRPSQASDMPGFSRVTAVKAVRARAMSPDR